MMYGTVSRDIIQESRYLPHHGPCRLYDYQLDVIHPMFFGQLRIAPLALHRRWPSQHYV